jgi:hypothetical protein
MVLAIVFLVVVGGIAAATLTSITSGLNNRRTLDTARDREYAADGAIEYEIARLVNAGPAGHGLAGCDSTPHFYTVGSIDIRAECVNVPQVTFGGFLQRNAVFTTCEKQGTSACTDDSTIVRAQVNFESTSGPITRTWVQSWSVNR